MRLTAFVLFLLFICMNLSFWIITTSQVLPTQQPAYSDPQAIIIMFTVSVTVWAIFTWITGHLIFGGTVALIVFGLGLFLPPIQWLIAGLPTYLGEIGISNIVIVPVSVLVTFTIFWFLAGLFVQRPLQED